jgi:hypothetical protein
MGRVCDHDLEQYRKPLLIHFKGSETLAIIFDDRVRFPRPGDIDGQRLA